MGSSKAYTLIPNRVILVQNIGDLTADNFHAVDIEIIALMQSATNQHSDKVNVLVDCTEMTNLPNITELEGGRVLKYFKESNCGWTMVVGYRSNPFLVVLSRLLTTVMGSQLHFAHTLRDAELQIKQLEPNLTDIPNIEIWKAEQIKS